ncbi:MAG: VWA domain-containing protein [Ruminococcus sp.]|nr:VWA domain-containing protein [Ruminococcus sp.]
MKRLAVIAMSILLVVLSVFAIGGYSATEITHEEEYKPLDLVVVVDGSGSMLSSDKDRTAPAAVRMLVNMMPAESRVGIISFNTKPTVLTKNTSGKGDLISLETIPGVETVRDASASIRYSGDTGIGNALFGATELLRKNSDNEHDKAIILFTDGLNDFGSGPLAAKNLSACDENESKAILWAKENDCCIYCIGYDYKTSSGVSSMGKNGEGITKLTNVAESTDGKFKAIKNIDDAKQLLIEFLADVCDLIYTTIDVIPGDGGYHECPIPVSPSVVEANIRIAGGDKNSIKNGTIKLQDPNGKEIELKNKGNIRVDKDATAQSIKIILPQPGEWILSVDGVVGDDIEVGLLEHFKMNLSSELTFPEGNPQGVAYSNDTIGIKTWLSYEGEDLVDQAIYDAVKSATATCVSRANPEDKKVVELSQNGTCFEGSFTIEEDSYYDIFIRVEWDTVYREDTLTVMSSNKPLGLVDQIEDVSVNKKKTVVIDNIYGYVSDDENDDITAQVEALNDDVVDVKLADDKIEITGKKWSSTVVDVTYTDEQGNTVSNTFKVTVNDPVAIALIIAGFILLGILIIIAIILLKKASNKVTGGMKVVYIAKGFLSPSNQYSSTEIIYENNNLEHDTNFVAVTENAGGVATDGDTFANDAFGGSADSAFGTDSSQAPGFGDAFGGSGFGNPFGGSDSGDAFGNSGFGDPFGGSGSDEMFGGSSFGDSFGGSGFDSNANFSFEQETPQNNEAENDFADVTFGDAAFGSNSNADVFAKDKEQSARFDEKIAIGGARVKSTTFANILKKFLDVYKEFMHTALLRESGYVNSIEDFINNSISVSAQKIRFDGTAFGQFGVVMKTDKNTLKSVVVHRPYLSKKHSASMNPNGKSHRVSLSFITGEKNPDGSVPCAHIELEYSKNN